MARKPWVAFGSAVQLANALQATLRCWYPNVRSRPKPAEVTIRCAKHRSGTRRPRCPPRRKRRRNRIDRLRRSEHDVMVRPQVEVKAEVRNRAPPARDPGRPRPRRPTPEPRAELPAAAPVPTVAQSPATPPVPASENVGFHPIHGPLAAPWVRRLNRSKSRVQTFHQATTKEKVQSPTRARFTMRRDLDC